MKTLFTDKENCCGCSACMNICPKQAITMIYDEEGFLYPVIRNSSCIECGLCKKVCAFQNGYSISRNYDEPLVYAVKHFSDEIRYMSTSGGMFTAISDKILTENGIIYGVGFNEGMIVCHKRAIDRTKRDDLRGSKYVQSDMGQTMKKVEMDLIQEHEVLFTGTPCQVAAVKEYMDKRNVITGSLVLCDIICHGVTSPLMFSEYIKLNEKKKDKKIINHIFRSKIHGWHNHIEMNTFEDGEVDNKSFISQLYKYLFYSHMILRPSCHNCKYTNLNRPSDITIADFWDIDKSFPEFDDNKGVSLVLINTEKGKMVFEDVKGSTINIKSDIKSCMQPNMKEASKPSTQREMFWDYYRKNGFEFVLQKYYGYGLMGRTKRMLSAILRKIKLYPLAKGVIKNIFPNFKRVE